MNEDLKPCLDIESEWEISPEYGTRPGIQIFQHKMHKDLLRVIDYRNQAFFFTDKHRVKLGGVIDINKKIEPIRKANLAAFLNRVMDAEKPISMPYVPENIKVYIEDLGDILGVLYYMDSDPDKTLVPIKRYFKMEKFQKPEEITFEEYQVFKEKIESNEMDCRDCQEYEDCPCGKDGHERGTSQGYSIGECKDFKPQKSEDKK